jgi:N-acetylglucosaminyl-diphospho-decaprenol L-rhamnosyltransferase
MISISIVSHGQIDLIYFLLSDLNHIFKDDFEVIITLNLPERINISGQYKFPIKLIENHKPLGFGANHNAAFRHASGEYFAVVNPDIRATHLNINDLLSVFKHSFAGICAPLVKNSHGNVEDSARYFPGIGQLFRRRILGVKGVSYHFNNSPLAVDWVAGMFMLIRSDVFQKIGGFDDRRYYMYFEDVDICLRLNRLGYLVFVQPSTFVVHDAQRASHRNIRHFYWHVISMIRYFSRI